MPNDVIQQPAIKVLAGLVFTGILFALNRAMYHRRRPDAVNNLNEAGGETPTDESALREDAPIMDTIASHFDALQLLYQRTADGDIELSFSGANTPIRAICLHKAPIITIVVPNIAIAPMGCRSETIKLLNLLNFGVTRMGRFYMDPNTGSVIFEFSMFASESTSQTTVEMMLAALGVIDFIFPALVLVGHTGTSAEEALGSLYNKGRRAPLDPITEAPEGTGGPDHPRMKRVV
jgi:hypothetical protein